MQYQYSVMVQSGNDTFNAGSFLDLDAARVAESEIRAEIAKRAAWWDAIDTLLATSFATNPRELDAERKAFARRLGIPAKRIAETVCIVQDDAPTSEHAAERGKAFLASMRKS